MKIIIAAAIIAISVFITFRTDTWHELRVACYEGGGRIIDENNTGYFTCAPRIQIITTQD